MGLYPQNSMAFKVSRLKCLATWVCAGAKNSPSSHNDVEQVHGRKRAKGDINNPGRFRLKILSEALSSRDLGGLFYWNVLIMLDMLPFVAFFSGWFRHIKETYALTLCFTRGWNKGSNKGVSALFGHVSTLPIHLLVNHPRFTQNDILVQTWTSSRFFR